MIDYKDKSYVCALDLGFNLIRGKWKAVILCHLDEGPKRFLELQRITHGVTQKVLTESLQQMEEEGSSRSRCSPKHRREPNIRLRLKAQSWFLR